MIDIEDAFANTVEIPIHGDEESAKELIEFVTAWIVGDDPDAPSKFELDDIVEACVRAFLAGQIFQAGNHSVTLELPEETVVNLINHLLNSEDS